MAKIRLVLADKYEIFLEGLAKLLKSNPGIEVVCTCCTGLETVENAFKYQPDVILMDTRLLECSGIEVAQRIHEELLKTNIIMLTHSETDEDLISAARAAKLVTLLSKREQAVLSLVAQGFTNKEIATTLVICENTVKAHLRNIMEKLHANTRQQAVSLVGGKDLLPRVTQTDTKQA